MTRNENPNPEIGWASKVPDNHCHKSSRHINLWLEEALQTAKNTREKLMQKRGAIFCVGKDGTLVSGLCLEFKRLQLCRCYGKRYPQPLSQQWKYMEVFPLHSKWRSGQVYPTVFLGSTLALLRECQQVADRCSTLPCPHTLSPRWGEGCERNCCSHSVDPSESQDQRLGVITFYLFRVSGIILTNIQKGNNLQILFSFNSPFISSNVIKHSKPAS